MHELTRLANYYGTDKGSEHKDYIHCYTEFYGPLLNHRRNEKTSDKDGCGSF